MITTDQLKTKVENLQTEMSGTDRPTNNQLSTWERQLLQIQSDTDKHEKAIIRESDRLVQQSSLINYGNSEDTDEFNNHMDQLSTNNQHKTAVDNITGIYRRLKDALLVKQSQSAAVAASPQRRNRRL